MRDILADRLKECRKQKGYTQAQVAIYCDITEKAYQNYELKTRLPKIDVLVRLADLYSVSIDYLVGRNDNKQFLSGKLKHNNFYRAKKARIEGFSPFILALFYL